MYKYLVLGVFLSIFFFLIKKNRVYVIPFILIIYSNINGLLDWEDFAFRGVIKFQDYGLVLSFILIVMGWVSTRATIIGYERNVRRSKLYQLILFYWGYYLFEFIYSIILQGDAEWPIKMGRVFFYGLVIFVIYKRIRLNPIAKFEKIVNSLMMFTLLFGILYVGYNLFDMDFYPKEASEDFAKVGLDEVKRNISGMPVFAGYFIILFTHNLMAGKGSKLVNLCGLLLLVFCQVLTLTRGIVILTGAIILLTILYRKVSIANFGRLAAVSALAIVSLPFLLKFAPGHIEALILRFSEFSGSGGAMQSGNFVVRAAEFKRIVANVIDFNPFFGFGFTNISLLGLGYHSSILHGGSADNGFSNLIGTTGFVGLGIFMSIIVLWIRVNIKLQMLGKEPYAKVNFLFIIFMLVSFMDGASMSYMHNYALFIAYDLLAYAYLTRVIKADSIHSYLAPASGTRSS